jgi:asparagine synthase (glutamine-hydrolysing)
MLSPGLAEILSFVRIPGSGVYRNVQELRPGHMAVCTENGMRISRYWSLQSYPHPDDADTTAGYIRALLQDAVKRQMIADVPVVSMLSGGLDSSGITALAAREFQSEGKELHTWSIDFVDSAQHFHSTPLHPSLDAPWVKRMSEYVGTIQPTPGCRRSMVRWMARRHGSLMMLCERSACRNISRSTTGRSWPKFPA